MSDIELPSEDDTFFDKDHIIFYLNEDDEIKCFYSSYNDEIFQDLILAVLSGAISEGTINFLIEDFTNKGEKDSALAMAVVKKLLTTDDGNPIVKPSNFR